jgi:hypothetical protein
MNARVLLSLVLSSSFLCLTSFAQSDRAQYSPGLANSYFNVNIGYINYPFTNKVMESKFQAEAIEVPHVAVKMVLFGHQFNKYLSAQVNYMRPVKYARFYNINGDKETHHAWMHYGGLTLLSQLPVTRWFSTYAEAGLGLVNRSGFEINGEPAVTDATYGTLQLGGGFNFHLNHKWDLVAGATYSPPNEKEKQPHTLFVSGGFRYTMRTLSAERVEEVHKAGYIFPKNILQFGYSTNQFGYKVNNFVSKKIPIFWGGGIEIEKGAYVHYQRNLFHTKKVFALDVSAGASWWQSSKKKEQFYTLSLAPVLRFTALRTRPADLYLFYSVAGPSYISKTIIDDMKTGRSFTFQDYMGVGTFFGKKRNLNAEVNINHYSNGNIFPENAGVKIPLTFNVGYTF